jgi:serine/threonine protein kinase
LTVSDRTCPTCQSPVPDDAAFCAQCGAATATQIFGETLSARTAGGGISVSYELEPERLKRALGPNFELGRLIGRGGYAEVFAIRDLRLKRELAIKVLRPDLIVTPSILTRFRREAEAVAALAHPSIVPVYDVGEAEGVCYILMPLIRGESLKSVLQRQRRLPIGEVRRIVGEAATALGAAHAAGIIHRDIKPENIMLEGDDRRVLVMDFGISKAMDAGEVQLTGTGVIVGTPQYMSPEQASGDPNIDHRTDQYSLAVCAYQMISGRPPFDGETARAIMAKQLLEEPTPLPELVENLPASISAGLYRALQKDPKRRFDSILEFAQSLSDASVTAGPTWQKAAPPPRPSPASAGRWVPWLIATGALGVAAVAATQLRPRPEVPAVDSTAPAPPPPPVAAQPQSAPPPQGGGDTSTRRPVIETPPTGRDTTLTAVRPAAPDSVPVAVAPVDCDAAWSKQDWPVAFDRCQAEGRSNPLAARRVAEMAVSGRGTPADERLATTWYEIAAPNDPMSQWLLAGRYDRGVGAEKSPTRATDLYLSAAQRGVAEAYPIIADRLERGIGRPRNEREAARWYERAAAGGDLASQVKIAGMYLAGRGVERSDSAAQRWFQSAAERNNPGAQFELARLLFRGGRGVPKSESAAMGWLERAAANGHAAARRELARRQRD